MKWRNRGHEFDNMYEEIIKKDSFYLFGAGDYGTQFYNAFRNEFRINGYIDNDIVKQTKKINGLLCCSLDEVKIKGNQGIILTMSQIARIHPYQQLLRAGYKRDVDFFVIEEFISVYNVYKYDKVYFSSISFLPSTVCNLKCRNCLNFNPFTKQFYVREWDRLIEDIDLFFECVDYIMLFHVSGGEPMLYKHIADVIEYIDMNYGDRIGTLRTVTNGTILPSDDVLKKLGDCNVEITVDDYRSAVPQYAGNFDRLIERLERYKIKYFINKADNWVDLAPERTDYSALTAQQLEHHRMDCKQSWQELRNGNLYSCNYAAYASVAGISGEKDNEERYDLTQFSSKKKKELVEFRLGYSEKGYTNFCKYCRGFCEDNTELVKPAVQIEN